jgi:tetratricopeptide (TPR) repeat protein
MKPFEDEMMVPEDGFFERYVLGAVGLDRKIGDKLFEIHNAARAAGKKYIVISRQIHELVMENKRQKQEQNELLRKTAELNNIGIAFEKEGKIDEAISAYEENIALGYKATHSFDRLRIIYRKMRDIPNMIRVIRREGEVYNLSSQDVEAKIEKYSGPKK